MTLLQSTTLAESQARQNWDANLAALLQTQPELPPRFANGQTVAQEWVFARDRTLTALVGDGGGWWSGCSVPRLAAEAVLGKLDVKGAVGCFLWPSHAAQLTSALRTLRPEQAIIAVVPDEQEAELILHCEDFAQDIAHHRLWLVAGADWEAQFHNLLESEPGLATPTNFIRMPQAPAETIDPMIAAAQRIFSHLNGARSTQIQKIRQSRPVSPSSDGKVLVVAPSRFRLWNDIGHQMLGIFANGQVVGALHFDADDPACSSPLALAMAATECTAIFTANTGRTDLPGIVRDTIPWITWVTGGRIPSSALAGADDCLIVVDPALKDVAIRSGWHERRVHAGGWVQTQGTSAGVSEKGPLSMIVDTVSLETPKDLADYSSHGLLWEAVRAELGKNPFVLDDVNQFLTTRMGQLGLGDEAFPRGRFIEKLILPAYQQGLARALIGARVPIRLHGRGWDALEEFKPFAAGPIDSRERFEQVIADSGALVHAWPTSLAHPIDACGLAVVRPHGLGSAEALAKEAQRAAPTTGQFPSLSIETILMILQACCVR